MPLQYNVIKGVLTVFWLGMFVGSTVGVVIMCLMQAASAQDDD